MSAAELRRAAALMRERAEAVALGPWEARHRSEMDWLSRSPRVDSSDHEAGSAVAHGDQSAMASVWPHRGAAAHAEHIASWHPAVALAVADWLDSTAREFDALSDPDLSNHPLDGRRTAGLAVARAYLGDPS